MFKFEKWRFWVVGMSLSLFSGEILADTLDAQRERYQQVIQAWNENQMDLIQQLLPTLREYPLYPYLEYRQLMENFATANAEQINQFLLRHPKLLPAKSLSSAFVNELARREDWRALLAFSPDEPKSQEARCNYYYAQWVVGNYSLAWSGAESAWENGKTLPAACDNLFTVWRASDQQTPWKTLGRIKLAYQEGNTTLLNELFNQLPTNYKKLRTGLMRMQQEPSAVLDFARSVAPTDFSRLASSSVFAKLARRDVEKARKIIPELVRVQRMSEDDQLALEEMIAWNLMGNLVTPEQAQWRDHVVQRSPSLKLLERRIRMALGDGDRQGLKKWLALLPEEARDKDEWRYWQANALISAGNASEGREILYNLMEKRGFYPMVAAQKLNIPYVVKVKTAAKPQAGLLDAPEIARVRELVYWNMNDFARNEWKAFVSSRDRADQEALARYAFEHQWADLSVQATIMGKLWDHLEERLPMPWSVEFQQALEDKKISLSYALAIARQESAWDPRAKSPVGASGLMQVMPRTAQQTVDQFNIPGYIEATQLFDPKTNIMIGSRYLDTVYQQFDHNRILASAAYNAGPTRVKTWLANSDGRIDAIAFIESIPFSETRTYVKNVLAYDAFYSYFMSQPVKILTDAEWKKRY